MSFKQIVESKYFKGAAIVCGVFLVALVSFVGGVKVGSHQALFSARFGENYERNFLGGPNSPDGRGNFGMPKMNKMMDRAVDKGMRNAHGVAGEILSISENALVIKDRDNQENTVRINESTIINRGKETVEFSTLVTGEKVVVVGKPQDDGVVAAHLIRVFNQDNAR